MAYQVTVEEMIKDAMLLVQASDEDEAVSPAGTQIAMRRLNNVLRYLSTRGMHMWRRQEVVLPLVAGQSMYLLGEASTDAEWADEEDFFSTTTTVAALSGASTITVSDATDIDDGDRIGVKLDDGTRHWTTVNGAPVGSVVTLTATLTDDVASGSSVYTYTTRPERPQRVLHARRRATATANDVPVEIVAQEEYQSQPTKTGAGTVTMVAYKPTLVSGRLFCWQAGSVNQLLRMTVEREFVEVTATSDTLDIPSEWNEAVMYRLAVALEPTYGQLDAGRVARLHASADRLQLEAEMFDADPGSIRFTAGRRR